MAIVWDFARQIDTAATPGNTTSYYDESCQCFYIDSGAIHTRQAQLSKGQWQNAAYGEEIVISDPGYSLLDIEHHSNNAVFGVAYHDGDVVFLVYEYNIDATNYIQKGVLQLQPNNSIVAAALDLSEVAISRMRDSHYSIFGIGNTVDLKYRLNENGEDADWYRLIVQGTQYDDISLKTVLKAKNKLTIRLFDQTFDDDREYTGTVAEIVTAILSDAGIDDALVDSNITSTTVSFDADQKVLDGLSQFCSQYSWYVDSLHDGTVIVGSDSFIQAQLPINTFTFERGDDAFSRYVENNTNGVITRVCIRRSGANPLKVYTSVANFEWDLPSKKTFYKDVPDDMSDGDMTALGTYIASLVQYSGIIEVFTTAFRPGMHIGDGVTITEGNAEPLAGIVLDVQHVFGEVEPHTQFTLYSGGTMMNTPATLTTKYISRLGHVDRTQQLLNFISSSDRR